MTEAYVHKQSQLIENVQKTYKLSQKLVRIGKVDIARKTGQRYQKITEEEATQIKDTLQELADTYNELSQISQQLDTEVLKIIDKFQETLIRIDTTEGDKTQ